MPDEKQTDDSDNAETKSTRTRWRWLGTVVAGVLLISLPALIVIAALGLFGASLSAISQPWFLLYSTLVMMAAVWTFGKETLEAVRKARGK